MKANGKWIGEPSHIVDIMATCLDAAGATYPKQAHGRELKPLQGRSLLPVAGGKPASERMLFWEHEGNCAARRGRWKAVRKFEGEWELYDMRADRTELNNLASSNPKLAKELTDAWQQWADRSGVLPWKEVTAASKNRV